MIIRILAALLLLGGGAWAQGVTPIPGVPANGGTFTGPITYPGRFDVRTSPYNAKCDGTTNDASAIQAAVTAAAGNANTYIPNTGSACMVGSTISVPSNSHITIDGTVKLVASANTDVFKIATSASNITFDGVGTIDGNKASETSGAGINSNTAFNVTIKDLTIQNTYNWPVNMVAVSSCYLSDLTLKNAGSSPEFAAGTTNCWAYGLKISGITDIAFALYGGVTYSGIIGGSISGGNGIEVISDGAQTAASHDITISGVSVSGSSVAGISVIATGGGSASSVIAIIGNVLSGNGQGGGGPGGVEVSNGNQVVIAGNNISKDGNLSTGVLLTGTNKDISVTNNLIVDEGQGGTNGVGISVTSGCTSCKVNQNTILDDQGSKTMAYALAGTAGTLNEFSWNSVSAMNGPPYSVTYASDTVVNVNATDGAAIVGASSAGSYSLSNANNAVLLHSSGIASYTVNLASNPPNGWIVRISCDGAIASLTVTPASGTLEGAPTACVANQAFGWQWTPVTSEWFKIQ